MLAAVVRGDVAALSPLLPPSLDARLDTEKQDTLLTWAARHGQAAVATLLLERGAEIDVTTGRGASALFLAAQDGHAECVRLLCGAGATVDLANGDGDTPLLMAAQDGHAECVRVLSSYGAARVCDVQHTDAEQVAAQQNHVQMLAWLQSSRTWTALHHVEVLTAARVRELLRGGADLHVGSPSPLERARAAEGEASALILRAAVWSPEAHELFPPAARARAVILLKLGHLLAWSPQFAAEARSLVDAWVGFVLPHAVVRGCC